VLRPDRDRQRLRQRAGVEVGDAAVEVAAVVFRIDPDRLAEIRDGAVDVALGLPGDAALS
jgi:hypothetical protein